MFKRWSFAVNEFLGIPRSGWGEDFPSVPIVLVALGIAWVFWVTGRLLERACNEPRAEVRE